VVDFSQLAQEETAIVVGGGSLWVDTSRVAGDGHHGFVAAGSEIPGPTRQPIATAIPYRDLPFGGV